MDLLTTTELVSVSTGFVVGNEKFAFADITTETTTITQEMCLPFRPCQPNNTRTHLILNIKMMIGVD